MSTILIVILVFAAIFAIRYFSYQAGRATEKGVRIAGTALGEALRPSEPSPTTRAGAEGELTVSKPGTDIRRELVEAGVVDPVDSRLVTPAGVKVELTAKPGVARLVCSWDDPTAQPTAVLGDVLRAVRGVDGGANVVL